MKVMKGFCFEQAAGHSPAGSVEKFAEPIAWPASATIDAHSV
jgi:hypothetical protein